MGFAQRIWRVAILTVAAIIIAAVVIGGLSLVSGYPTYGPPPLDAFDWFKISFMGSIFVGSIPAIAIGIPIYTYFLGTPKMSFGLVLIAAVAPGLVMSGFVRDLGLFLIGGGLLFILILHGMASKWPDLNSR